MSKRAWVTLATNDSYSLGALVLAHSLQRVGSAYPAVVMIAPSVTQLMRDRLSTIFAEVIMVDVLDSEDAAHLALLARPELGITFTKLHCWKLIQYEKAVFLDADTLVLQNCDDLFEREELSAAPDVGWPDCFNSGVFVFQPSSDTFESLLKFAREKGSFDGGDQGLLNMYFSSWATSDIAKHLPFLYNVCSAAFYSYLPALKQYGQNMKIMHFIGNAKPWLQDFNWETRSVQGGDAGGHLQPALQLWWDIFCSNVHQHLDPTMAMCESALPAPRAPARYQLAPDPLSHFPWHRPDAQPQPPSQHQIALAQFYDPWDNYRGEIAPSQLNHIQHTHHSTELCAEDANHNQHDPNHYESNHGIHRNSCEHDVHQNHLNQHDIHYQNDEVELHDRHNDREHDHDPDFHTNHEHVQRELSHSQDSHPYAEPLHINIPEQTHYYNGRSESECSHSQASESDQYESPLPSTCVEVEAPKPRHPYDNFYIIHRPVVDESGCKRCSHEVVATPTPPLSSSPPLSPGTEDDQAQAGLAGTFSQLSLGAGVAPGQQEALEQHTRRQGWESGNIDYMGADAFDNIWARISQTLTSPQMPPADASSASITETQAATEPIIEKKSALVVAPSAPVQSKPVVGILKPPSPSPPVRVDVAKVDTKITETPTTPIAATLRKQESIATPKSVEHVVSPTATPRSEQVSEHDTKSLEDSEAVPIQIFKAKKTLGITVLGRKGTLESGLGVRPTLPRTAPKRHGFSSAADEQNAPGAPDAAPLPLPSLARKPKGKLMCHLRAAPEPTPVLTPDSEFEDAASLAQSIIASELTPTVTSPTPPALCSPPLLPQLTKDLSVDSTVPETPPAKGLVSLAQIGILPNSTVEVKVPANVIQQPKEAPCIFTEPTVDAQVATITSADSVKISLPKVLSETTSDKTLLDSTMIKEDPVEPIYPSGKIDLQTKSETAKAEAGDSENFYGSSAVVKEKTIGFRSNEPSNITSLNVLSSEATCTEQILPPKRPKIKKLPREEQSGTQAPTALAGMVNPPVPPPRKKEKKLKEKK